MDHYSRVIRFGGGKGRRRVERRKEGRVNNRVTWDGDSLRLLPVSIARSIYAECCSRCLMSVRKNGEEKSREDAINQVV